MSGWRHAMLAPVEQGEGHEARGEQAEDERLTSSRSSALR